MQTTLDYIASSSLRFASYVCSHAVQVSEVLAKVVRQQAEVVDLAEKRAEVLSCIEEFEAVRAECRWLNEYEHDEMRYKVGQASIACETCSFSQTSSTAHSSVNCHVQTDSLEHLQSRHQCSRTT